MKLAAPLDANLNELQNSVFQNLSSNHGSPVEGLFFWRSDTNHAYIYDGSVWLRLDNLTSAEILSSLLGVDGAGSGLDADLLDGTNGAAYLDRANHTGTQLANTISNFDTQVRTSRLDQMAVPTASVSFNSQKITNLLTPTASSDGATKGYVDASITGLDWKDSVRMASTANVNISAAPVSIDGVTGAQDDRVLLKNQTTGAENGIYIYNGSGNAMTRASDADTSAEVTPGMAMFVSSGTTNGDTAWLLTTDGPIVLNTTALTFAQFFGGGTFVAGTGITISGNTISINTAYVGQASITTLGTITTGVWNGTTIAVANGGTGSTTAAGARTNLGAVGRYSALIGDGSTTLIIITQATHGLAANQQLLVAVYSVGTGEQLFPSVLVAAASGDVSLLFSVAPTTNSLRVVIIG